MRINFLTGDAALSKSPTGVGLFHRHLFSDYAATMTSSNDEALLTCFRVTPRTRAKDAAIPDHSIEFSNTLTRVLSIFFPIDLFSPIADVYICDGFLPKTIRRSKKIAIVHDLMVFKYPQNYSLATRIYLKHWFRQCKKADIVITMSNTTKNDLIDLIGIDESIVRVAHPAFEQKTGTENQDNSKSKDALIRPFVFYIGDMRPNKNLVNAIKGFEIAAKNDKDLHFYIAGSRTGEFEKVQHYVELRSLENRVHFLGYISNTQKEELFKNGRALIFSSLYEGFGIPILEAARKNCPVITSNLSSMKEIAHGASILIDPENPNEIAKAILSLQDEKYADTIKAKQRKVAERYPWSKTLDVFRDAIAN